MAGWLPAVYASTFGSKWRPALHHSHGGRYDITTSIATGNEMQQIKLYNL